VEAHFYAFFLLCSCFTACPLVLCACVCVFMPSTSSFFFYKAAWFFDGPVILRRLVHVVLEFSECFWFSSFPFLVVALMWADLFVFSQVAACACASEGLGECVRVCVCVLLRLLLFFSCKINEFLSFSLVCFPPRLDASMRLHACTCVRERRK
jgi:hypothetical protein